MTVRCFQPQGSRSGLELHSPDRGEAMLLPEVPVSAHCQCAAVLVPEPPADCRYVHSGFDARGREKMPKVVMGESRVSQTPTGCLQTLLGIHGERDSIAGLRVPFVAETA